MPAYLTEALEVYEGDVLRAAVDFVGNANVSALVFRAQWRSAPKADTALEFAIDMAQAATGRITISLTSAQTAQMGGAGVFDVLLVTGPTETRALVAGKTSFSRGVTRV